MQFTPDLMPSDVTGVSIYDRQSSQFEFRPGPIFANIVVADEINRASPKTQSALLECMEERQVTVDGTSYQLARPFLVLATQNPVEMEGTYPLPEAQRDRFLARLSIGYPDRNAEIGMLADRDRTIRSTMLRPVTDAATVSTLIDAVTTVHLAPPLRQYIVEIIGATRAVPEVRLGASPRAVLHLARAAKAAAALDGRPFVVPDDIQRLAVPVLAHRLLLTVEAHAAHRSAEEVVGGAAEPDPGAPGWLSSRGPAVAAGGPPVADGPAAAGPHGPASDARADHPRSLPAGRRDRRLGLRGGAGRTGPAADRHLRRRAAADRDARRVGPAAAG